MTIQEAAKRLGKSEATIRRWIKQGKLESTLIDGKYSIEESALDAYANSEKRVDNAYANMEADQLRRQNEELLRQVSSQQERISKLEEQLESERQRYHTAAERHDIIVMQMTRQTETQQKLLEYHEDPWYRRWFRKTRKTEVPQGDVVDMEAEDASKG